jgi:transposase-like protein
MKRNKHSKEFKLQVVKEAVEPGIPQQSQDVMRSLQICYTVGQKSMRTVNSVKFP